MERGSLVSNKQGAPQTREMHPRDLAVRALTRVLSDGVALDRALEECAPPESRAWLQDVCAGTLRWKGRLDLAIDSVALKKKPSGWLRKMLLIAAYQLVVQDRAAPAHIVSETVNAIRKREGAPPAAFANALLRKVSEHAKTWAALPIESSAPAEVAAAQASLPLWLWKKLVAKYGLQWTAAYAQASLERPSVWVRSLKLGWIPPMTEEGPVPASWRLKEGGAITQKEGFTEGHFFVQDVSSQFLIHEISERVRSTLGQGNLTALDLCAAPGGKTAGLAQNGFAVSASDVAPGRMLLLEETRDRLKVEFEVLPREEVTNLPAQDLVWVDAPCSGSGILRRHPDARWLRREQELAGLRETQNSLFREGWEKVKPGGFLAYSVCSLLPEEGLGVVEALGFEAYLQEQWLLAPHLPPFGDGFWAGLLRKPI